MKQCGGTLAAAVTTGLLALLVTACNDTSFKSQNPRKAQEAKIREPVKKKADATLKLSCTDGQGEARLVTDLKGTEATEVRLEGEFCGIPDPAATGKLTVLFVLDQSGSMGAKGGGLGNDPLVNGTCGRLQAAEAIVSKLESDLDDGVEAQVGMLAFGSTALPVVTPVSFTEFKAHLKSDRICSDAAGGTNYDAAFTGATAALSGIEGSKVVYFVSDGVPTHLSGALGPRLDMAGATEAGRKAAALLRALPDLTFNTLFLGSAGSSTNPSEVDPKTYLEEITGSKERVKLIANAADLATEIVKFETPEALVLDKESVSASVSAAAFGQNSLKLASLVRDTAREGVWTFVTEPFTLFVDPKKAVENEVVLTVKGGDGKDYKATALITFEMDAE